MMSCQVLTCLEWRARQRQMVAQILPFFEEFSMTAIVEAIAHIRFTISIAPSNKHFLVELPEKN